ncbi:MAG TPA: TonB-dependent receptor [Cyclobacteriaceae bacterium]|nr:TonB-dependent receptor [Cyclobacteriaceae bacterium]HRJ82373.1 TonB-dependent receptor [Cyclobacteriaceae bacterium]
MKNGILIALVLLVAGALAAQTKISGMVTDTKGEPIPGANILLLNTYDGTTSGADGKFDFLTSEEVIQVLVVKFIGYKEYRQSLDLTASKLTVHAVLKEEINQLEAVTITAGAFAASDESRRTIFRALDIATTAGATADIAGALNTLPGTQKVGESGRLFVRGGDGNEVRTFIDGMLVLDAYGPAAPNTPSRGRFLPFMFKGTSFSTGGYSAEYGQALSSALVLDSKDEEQSSRTDFGLLSVGADVAHTQAWKNASWAGKIGYTNIRPYFGLINQEVDWEKAPVSIEGSSAYRQRVGKSGMFKVYGNFNHSNFSLHHHDIDDPDVTTLIDINNNFRYLNGSYKTSLNEKWSLRSGLSYTLTQNDVQQDDVRVKEYDEGIHSKVVFDGSLSDKVEIRTGAEVINRDYHAAVDTSSFVPGFHEVIPAAFVEADLYASNKFVTRVGGRVEYNNLLNQLSVDPRISLAYKTGKTGQVSFAYGKFRQSPKNEWLRWDNQLAAEKSDHYILNYQLIENRRTFRVEGYYKTYSHLVKFENGNPFVLNNEGSGYARGVELFYRDNKTIRNADYWISYSFLDTERDYLNTPYAVTPSFASAHNFSVVYKHFVAKLKTQFGATYSFTSGRPYNNPNEDKFNNGRTKSYQDLSVNISYLPKPHLIVYFSCTNLLGRDNIFGFEYSTTQNNEGFYNSRAIRQPAPRFVFLGVFITLSKDKSINQLPSL